MNHQVKSSVGRYSIMLTSRGIQVEPLEKPELSVKTLGFQINIPKDIQVVELTIRTNGGYPIEVFGAQALLYCSREYTWSVAR